MVRPKVAFVCSKTPFPTRGGLDLRIESICRALSKFSDVTLICLNGESEFKPDYCEQVIAGSLNIDFPNHEIIKWQKNNPLDPLGIFVTQKSLDFLRSALKSVKAQHIFMSRVATWRVFEEISGLFNAKNHLDLDETSSRLESSYESLTSISVDLKFVQTHHRNIKAYERKILPELDSILVSSSIEQEDVERNYGVKPGRCVVIENTLSIDSRHSAWSNSDRSGALFPGNFSYPPNRVAMREIVLEIAPQLPNLEFIFAGSNLDNPQYPLPKNVRLLKNPDSMEELFRQALLLIAPLRFGAGTRYKIIEAMFHGLPIIATEFAVEGLGLIPCTHYLKAELPVEFVLQLKSLFENPAKGKKLTDAAYNYANSRYSTSAIEAKLLQIVLSGD
jgi:glycosyltransferase involved in cell wall biosynthesis